MQNKSFFIILFALIIGCHSNDLILQVRELNEHRRPEVMQMDGQIQELVIPRITTSKNEPLKRDLSQMATAGDFTVLYKHALRKAIALSADGVWQNFIQKTRLPTNASKIFMGYDDQFLHLSAFCDEPQMDKLMAFPGKSGKDDRAYASECMDMIFSSNRNYAIYKQVIISAYGGIYTAEQLRQNESGRTQSNPSWQPVFPWKVIPSKDHWELHAAIPLAAWGIPIQENSFVDMNLARNGMINKEFSSWGAVQNSFNEKNGLVRVWFGAKKTPEIAIKTITIPPGKVGKNILVFSLHNSGGKKFSGKATLTSDQAPEQAFSREINLAGGTAGNFELPWDARKSGPHKLLFKLFSEDNQILDLSDLPCDIPPPMQIHLESSHFTHGNLPVPGKIELALQKTLLQQSTLQFSIGNMTHSFKSPPENGFSFLLNTEKILPGNTVLKVDLLSENGETLYSDQLALIIVNDPFEEE